MTETTDAGFEARTDSDAPTSKKPADRSTSLRRAAAELTKFQVRVLAILADEARYGLAIRRALSEYYREEVNHGRLYPNLDDLADLDLIEKSALDKRTNEYAITAFGRGVLQYEIDWLATSADESPTGSYLPAETEESDDA